MESRRKNGRWIAVVVTLGAVIGTTSLAPAVSQAEPVVVEPGPVVPAPPEFDPGFYRPSADRFAGKAPGEIIAARQITVANFGLIPLNVDAWSISYRSNNSRDEAIPAVATVLKPRGSSPDKLLSMQIAEDSLAGYCAPSYTVQQWSLGLLGGQVTVPAEFIAAQGALQQGWAVVIPDHQGPDEAYAAGPLAGRITLDGIRAARAFEPLQLDEQARIGMYGYSGGALATGHAAELKRDYAPELNIVGAAEGGVAADLGAVVNQNTGQLGAGVIMAAIFGIGREYPEFGELLRRDLDPLGQGLAQMKNGLCVGLQAVTFPFLNFKGMLRSDGDPLQQPVVRDVLDKTRMGKRVPDMPLFIWQANPDELIPVGQVNTLVDTYCTDPRAQVQYTREHLGEHIATAVSGLPTAMLWLRDRLEGIPAAPGCSTFDAGLMALNPEGMALLSSVFGETVASFFGKAIGVK